MLADEAAGVLARRAGFGAEARGERGEAQGQFGLGEDRLAHEVGEADFGGGDQPEAVGGVEQVLGELGQLRGAIERGVAHQHRRRHFLVAEAGGVGVEHELAERTVEPGEGPAQIGEARARDFLRALEIEAQRAADVDMVAAAGGVARGAPAGDLDVVVLVGAVGDFGGGEVGERCQPGFERGGGFGLRGFERGQVFLDARDFGHDVGGARLVLGGLGGADRLACLVAAGEHLLRARLQRARLGIGGEQLGRERRQPAPGEAGVERFRGFADQLDVVHGPGGIGTVCSGQARRSATGQLGRIQNCKCLQPT